jgi:thiol-disulfide isomerase/thioredoxin
LPGLEQLKQQYGKDGLVVLGVNVGEESKKAKDHYTAKKVTWQVLVDAEERVAGVYNIESFPTYVFVDKEGKINRTLIGGQEKSDFEREISKIK